MKRKLLLFAGAFGILAGSLVYSQGGDNIPDPIPAPTVEIEDREVVGRWTERKEDGPYGLWIFLQRRDGRVAAGPSESHVRMANGQFKAFKDVQVGEKFYTYPPRQ